ncbi:GntR family transcriptional repressor for pyruvate dehydrogenase complex [Bradyrhizobium sp. USDA 3256]
MEDSKGARLERIRPARLYETVIDSLGKWSSAQGLRAGAQLPTERVLEAELGVSRPVVREAFRVLEASGVIASRQGGGRYLLRNEIPTSDALRSIRLDNSRDNLLKLWETREIVECKAAELAAKHATKEQVRDIFRPLENLKVVEPEDYRASDANIEFHIAVARASGNVFLEGVVRNLVDEFRRIDFKYLLPLETWDTLQSDHLPIAKAIKAKDARGAKRAMQHHFDTLRKSIG